MEVGVPSILQFCLLPSLAAVSFIFTFKMRFPSAFGLTSAFRLGNPNSEDLTRPTVTSDSSEALPASDEYSARPQGAAGSTNWDGEPRILLKSGRILRKSHFSAV
ncbi:Hypothetical protein NTJ_08177 [Nesidiocoris tenuis]|uniref:Uncharacterized protein n=1 Tax=Nesidiocoris tenuis TaxID=355587 RepID=A0ABN7AT33_9HEMI|nr:Hypothetical protein NTJ_08177 [Nesidiocoris tenuis]